MFDQHKPRDFHPCLSYTIVCSCRISTFYINASENDENIFVNATECEMFIHNNFTNNTETMACSAWDYEKSTYMESATSEVGELTIYSLKI